MQAWQALPVGYPVKLNDGSVSSPRSVHDPDTTWLAVSSLRSARTRTQYWPPGEIGRVSVDRFCGLGHGSAPALLVPSGVQLVDTVVPSQIEVLQSHSGPWPVTL